MKQLPLASIACLALLAVSISGCSSGKEGGDANKNKPRTPKAAGWVVSGAPFPESPSVLASVVADQQVELRSEMAGRLVSVTVRDGQAVKAGQILAQLDDAETRAVRDRAAARLKLAQLQASRIQEQVGIEAASRQQLDVAQADFAVAKAEADLAQAQWLRTQVRAPFAGKVGLLKVDQGQWLTAGQVIGQLVAEAPLRLEAAMPEARAAWMQVGQKLSWTTGKDSGSARVDALEPYLDAQTRTRALRAKVEGKVAGLLPGASVELKMARDTTAVLTVPSQALSGDVRGILVWVVRGGKSFPVPVVTGRRGTDRIEIRSGLSQGDTVIMPGGSTLKPDGNVEIVRLLSEVRK